MTISITRRARRGLAVAGLVAATLGGLAAGTSTSASATQAGPKWHNERGNVIECVGQAHGVRIWTSVYENQRYGNTVQVVLGGPDDGHGNSKSTKKKFLVDGVVHASVKVDGKRVRIEGTAERQGPRTKVYDEYEDAGYLIKTRGFHRQLVTDLSARYAGKTIPLTCDTAFFYNLEVKKIPIV